MIRWVEDDDFWYGYEGEEGRLCFSIHPQPPTSAFLLIDYSPSSRFNFDDIWFETLDLAKATAEAIVEIGW